MAGVVLARQRVPIGDLHVYPGNARQGDVGAISQSLGAHGQFRALVVQRSTMRVVAGNHTLLAMRALGWTDAECDLIDVDDDQARRINLVDNRTSDLASYDDDALARILADLAMTPDAFSGTGFDGDDLDQILADLGRVTPPADALDTSDRPSLANRFVVPPISVLDARQGYWRDRRATWMRLGIQSHYGRDHTQGFAPFPVVAGVDTKTREVRTTAISPQAGDGSLAYAEQQSYVSVFDPVLCEVAYRWWSPTGGAILDPFAGGSVRGIVAAILDRDYLGIDISAEQVAANDAQAAQIVPDHEHAPRWIVGDATKLADVIPSGYDCDFVFSCPPYGDLEVYSDDPRDLSAMTPAGFEDAYRAAIAQAVARLRPDRFACFVVGEYRRDDVFAGLIPTTISAFRDAGMDYYNEAAFITPYGSLPVRAARTFSPGRKLGKTHQNVLVFVKGDARCAVEACGPIGVDLPDDMRDDDDAGA